ncbi:hypothetical protein [Leucothrix pacifica]|uniref:Uncharacterized protein n=1 Tax=Leucothrix pacifica TaxID=1247513 RepID=A0A317CHK3_9GAMM|nr:hypothetical protein [Leucothrix pacifica]PWQ98034.1 hypothetical protein DKW60_08825 [Leucothrix pacifica]
MPTYRLSSVSDRYQNSANPPVLDKVVFTLDHIHAGSQSISSTYEVVKYLVDHGIPVVVFFQATSPSHDYEFDRDNARLIYNLAPHLVTLGVHPLPKGNTQADQTRVFNVLSGIIQTVTGKKPQVLSYHGSGAGPMPGISFPGIKYARGIGSSWTPGTGNRLDTPVMPLNSVQRAFDYTTERNAAGLTSTLFLHTSELAPGTTKKKIFDTFVTEVKAQRLQALPYFDAMAEDFNDAPSNGGSGGGTGTGGSGPGGSGSGGSGTGGSTPPTTPTTETGSLRLSASESPSRRPLKANFKVQKITGQLVDSANNLTTKQFIIPVGKYRVSATALGKTETKELELTRAKGLHHIFMISAASGGSGSTPTTPSTPPPSVTGAQGSLRLSASEKQTRRPIKADFLIQDLSGKLIQSATSTTSQLFRLPPASYQVSAIVGGESVSNEITLTATQGIHHIFLVPTAGSSPSTPSPTPTPTPSTAGMGSLRLSASDKITRRPLSADFLIQDMSGKLVDTSADTTTSLFRIPAGQYQVKAHSGGKSVTATINLTRTQGIHHIFLIPS